MYYFQVYNTISRHGRRKGGGGKNRSSPSPLENKNFFFLPYWGHFSYFFFIWGLFATFFSLWRAFFTMWEPFCFFLFHDGGLLGSTPPLRLQKFLRAPMFKVNHTVLMLIVYGLHHILDGSRGTQQ